MVRSWKRCPNWEAMESPSLEPLTHLLDMFLSYLPSLDLQKAGWSLPEVLSNLPDSTNMWGTQMTPPIKFHISIFPNCKYFLYCQLTLTPPCRFLTYRYPQPWSEKSWMTSLLQSPSVSGEEGDCMRETAWPSSLPEVCPFGTALGLLWWKLLGHPLKINAHGSYHSPQLPPTDLAAETWAVHTDFVSDNTLHGVDRPQAWGTHFFQHGLKKEKQKLNNPEPWPPGNASAS